MKDEEVSLYAHLQELRKIIIFAAVFLTVGTIVSFIFLADPFIGFIKSPLEIRKIPTVYTEVGEGLAVRFKISFVLGSIISSPFIAFLIWHFIRPGLYESEIRRFRLLFIVCIFLFLLGIIFCYTAVYTLALDFFLIAGEGIATPLFSMSGYVSFLASFILPFGFAFELPVIIYMLSKHGLINLEKLKAMRKYVLLAIVTFSAILTPPDVISQLMLSLPLYLLYEAGILVTKLTTPKASDQETTDPSA